MQPSSHPSVFIRLLGNKLYVCVAYYLYEGGNELRWSQGGGDSYFKLFKYYETILLEVHVLRQERL